MLKYILLFLLVSFFFITIYKLDKTNKEYEALIYIQDAIITTYRKRFGDIEVKIDTLED